MKVYIKTILILTLGQAYILQSMPPETKNKTPLAAIIMDKQSNPRLENKHTPQKISYTTNTSPLEVCCLFSLPSLTGIAMWMLQAREKQA